MVRRGTAERATALLGACVAGLLALTAAPAARSAPAADDDVVARAAARLGLTEAQLHRRLDADATLEVDRAGRLRVVDAGVDPAVAAAAEAEAAPTRRSAPAASLTDTFALHSRPGSDHTVYLDFDGQRVEGSAWNLLDLLPVADHPAWDPSGNGPEFDADELASIQTVWRRVSEDYAPFDVNVTTQDPGAAALERTSRSDPTYGVRMLISPSSLAQELLCGSCGGVAYVDVFSLLDDAYRVGWIFPGSLADRAAYVADAASHEVGHTLGLIHDGKGVLDPYYGGHGVWAPIMGTGYGRPVSQFSNGEYSGATNTEDDLAVIAGHLGLVPDEAPSEPAGAPTLSAAEETGVITTAADRDVFALGTCADTVTVSAHPAAAGANVDLGLALLTPDGQSLASADPPVGALDATRATGLEAVVTADLATPTDVLVRVDGVGYGTPSTGYSDYGSVGGYRITATGTCDAAAVTPPTPTQEVTVDRAASTIRWKAPRRASTGSAVRLRVRVATDGAATATGRVRLTFDDRIRWVRLEAGTATYRLRVGGRPRRLVVRARYRGDVATAPSTGRTVIRVRRR